MILSPCWRLATYSLLHSLFRGVYSVMWAHYTTSLSQCQKLMAFLLHATLGHRQRAVHGAFVHKHVDTHLVMSYNCISLWRFIHPSSGLCSEQPVPTYTLTCAPPVQVVQRQTGQRASA
jgi:hypothetical protein